MNIQLYCLLIAIECPPFPQVENADITGSGIQYNSTIYFSCHSGLGLSTTDVRRQENGQLSNVISCQQNSNWSVSSISCECKYTNF